MKKYARKTWVWLLAVALILGAIPAAYLLAKTVEAQAAKTVFFYVTNADGKDILVRAAPIDEIRELAHPMEDGQNYAVSCLDSLPTACYAEAQGFTTAELIAYLNSYLVKENPQMAPLTYQGQDRLYFMADDSFSNWTRSYFAEVLDGVERKYVEGLYEGWEEYGYEEWFEDFDLENDAAVAAKEAAWATGEPMPAILSTLSYSGRTTTNVSETSDGILEYVLANGGTPRGCLKEHLVTDTALTLFIPTCEAQFMQGARTASENFKWIYALKLKMAAPPPVPSKGTVPAAKPSYRHIEENGKTLVEVTLSSPMEEATIYYNDGQGNGSSAQTRYEAPFTIDVTGLDLALKPVIYYTRTVREGYDDMGPLSVQYYQVPPTIQSVSAGSPLGEDVVFEAQAKVTAAEWQEWSSQITRLTLGYPDGTSRVLAAAEYRIDNEERTITLDKTLFSTTGSHALTVEAAGYASRKASRTMKGEAPAIVMAAGYPQYEDIVLTFADPTGAYHSNITVKINGKSVGTAYLDRSEPGKLTIMASGYAAGALGEPGEYTLELTNNNYLPKEQTLTLKIIPALIDEEPVCREGVYLIADAADLFWFAKQVNVKGIKEIEGRLTADINLNDAPWTPIGTSLAISYSGVFDGNGFQISGLNVNIDGNYQGLFGYIRDATIKNLTVSGQVTGKGNVGGIVGQAMGSQMTMGSTIDRCVNKATVQGTVNTGGIVGFTSWASVIQGCSNEGAISGTESVGGICGQTASTTVVLNCINLGQVHGGRRVGGITGTNYGFKDGLSVDRCVNCGAVSADENEVGGICGYVQKLISNCYNTGSVQGGKNDTKTGIGGIVGLLNQERIINCYNTGLVSCSVDGAQNSIGAVVGLWKTDNESAGNYYLKLEDGLSGIGVCSYPETAPDKTEGKTSAEMKALAPLLGEAYVEDSYQINDGYPVLDWQGVIAAANQEAADPVIELIDAIGEVGADDASRDRIAAAREAFELLTQEQQRLVSNEPKLSAAEAAYATAVAELAAKKEAAKEELEGYKDPANYRKSEQIALATAIAAGKAEIDAAPDIAGVEQALAKAKAALDQIKTETQLTAEEQAAPEVPKKETAAPGKATDKPGAKQSSPAAAGGEADPEPEGTAAQQPAEEGNGSSTAAEKIRSAVENTVAVEIDDSFSLNEEILEAMKETGKKVTFAKKKNGRVLYSWTFDGDQVNAQSSAIDLSISFTSPYRDEIEKLVGDSNSLYLSFAHDGELPAPVEIKLYVGDKYEDGNKPKLYYFNEQTGKAEEIAADLEVIDGYISFTLTHLSSYFLTTAQNVGAKSGLTTAIWLAALGLCAVGVFVVLMIKKRKA